MSKKKEIKKEIKQLSRAIQPKTMAVKSLKQIGSDLLWNGGNSIARAIKNSNIGINTPFGGVGVGFNGLVLNPPGGQYMVKSDTVNRVGKRASYFTTHAPRVRGFQSGLRVVASQVISNVYQSATAAGGLSTAGVQYITISPDSIGGQMALDARNYNRWRLARLMFEYSPQIAVGATASGTITALAQNLIIAYMSDAAAYSFASLTYGSLQNVADNTVIPAWTTGGLVVNNLGPKDTLYYSETDTASDSSIRLTQQGLLEVVWNVTPTGTGSAVVGEIVMHYVLDLYDRASDYGFTISVEDSVGLEALKLLFGVYGDKLSYKSRMKLRRLLSPVKEPGDLSNEIGILLQSHDYVKVKESPTPPSLTESKEEDEESKGRRLRTSYPSPPTFSNLNATSR